jgi:hypothetical protein
MAIHASFAASAEPRDRDSTGRLELIVDDSTLWFSLGMSLDLVAGRL